MNFRVEALGQDTYNVWVEGKNSTIADGRVQPRKRTRGYWEALVNDGSKPTLIESGKSRGGCLIAVLEHFMGA